MTFGFAPSAATSMSAAADSANRLARMLEPAEWAAAGIPLLRSPREVVSGLHARHRPTPQTAVVAVLDHEERLTASASFARRSVTADGGRLGIPQLAAGTPAPGHPARSPSPHSGPYRGTALLPRGGRALDGGGRGLDVGAAGRLHAARTALWRVHHADQRWMAGARGGPRRPSPQLHLAAARSRRHRTGPASCPAAYRRRCGPRTAPHRGSLTRAVGPGRPHGQPGHHGPAGSATQTPTPSTALVRRSSDVHAEHGDIRRGSDTRAEHGVDPLRVATDDEQRSGTTLRLRQRTRGGVVDGTVDRDDHHRT